MSLGFAGIAGWPTYTTPGVVPYGILLALIFVVPGKIKSRLESIKKLTTFLVGIIKAMVRTKLYTASYFFSSAFIFVGISIVLRLPSF